VTLTLYLVPDRTSAAHVATLMLAVIALGVFLSNLLHPKPAPGAGRSGAGEPLEL
jgi:hypothetical protein